MADVDLAHESSLPVSFLSISSRTALYIFIYLLPQQNDEEEDEFVRLFVKFICREGQIVDSSGWLGLVWGQRGSGKTRERDRKTS